MSQQIQLRRGTAAELATITPAQGEPCWTTDTKKLFVGDSTTAGGIAIGLGTVTNTGGSLTLNRLVLGAGTNDIKTIAGVFTDGTSKLTLGQAGTSVGGLLLANATSGTVELRPVTGALGTSVISVPAATDTMGLLAAIQTFTNKTLTAPTLTSPGIDLAIFTTAAAPATPAAGKVIIYAKVDKLLYSKDDAGVETLVSGGAGGGGGSGDMLLGTAQTVTAAKTFNAGTLKIAASGDLVDNGGNELFKFVATASAVNEFTITNGATGSAPKISCTGGDSNVGAAFLAKGTGAFTFSADTANQLVVNLDSGSSTDSVSIVLKTGGTSFAQISVAGVANGISTGSGAKDLVLRSNAKNIDFSTDSGSSVAGQFVATTGQFALLKGITSTTNTTGTLVVTGGVGISENLNVGGSTNLGTGVWIGTSTPASITSTSGALVISSAGTNQDINLRPVGSGRVRTLAATGEIGAVYLDTVDSTAHSSILMSLAGTPKLQFGAVGGTDQICTGTVAGNVVIRANSSDLVYTTDGGISLCARLSSTGAFLLLKPTAGLGYGTGAGGTVTQATSKSTGVTLNKVTGAITMNNASLASLSAVSFTLTNSAIAATDIVTVNIKSGATGASYVVSADAVAAGSCQITLYNYTLGALGEAVVLNFAIIKGVTS